MPPVRLAIVALLALVATPARAQKPTKARTNRSAQATETRHSVARTLREARIEERIARKPGRLFEVRMGDGVRGMFRRPVRRAIFNTFNLENPPVREFATYRTARRLGFDVVPTTVMRTERFDGRLERGSLVEFVEGDTQLGYLVKKRISGGRYDYGAVEVANRIDWESVHEMLVLDYITGQRDRGYYNILFHDDGERIRVRAIDNEASFVTARQARGSRPEDGAHVLALIGARAAGKTALADSVQKKLDAMTPTAIAAWKTELSNAGLSSTEINGAVRRLHRVKREGIRAIYEHPVGEIRVHVRNPALEVFGAPTE